jgi:hypothetical protein
MRKSADALLEGWVAAAQNSVRMKIQFRIHEKLVWDAIHSIDLLLPDLRLSHADGLEATLQALAFAPGGKHFQAANVRFNGKRKEPE